MLKFKVPKNSRWLVTKVFLLNKSSIHIGDDILEFEDSKGSLFVLKADASGLISDISEVSRALLADDVVYTINGSRLNLSRICRSFQPVMSEDIKTEVFPLLLKDERIARPPRNFSFWFSYISFFLTVLSLIPLVFQFSKSEPDLSELSEVDSHSDQEKLVVLPSKIEEDRPVKRDFKSSDIFDDADKINRQAEKTRGILMKESFSRLNIENSLKIVNVAYSRDDIVGFFDSSGKGVEFGDMNLRYVYTEDNKPVIALKNKEFILDRKYVVEFRQECIYSQSVGDISSINYSIEFLDVFSQTTKTVLMPCLGDSEYAYIELFPENWLVDKKNFTYTSRFPYMDIRGKKEYINFFNIYEKGLLKNADGSLCKDPGERFYTNDATNTVNSAGNVMMYEVSLNSGFAYAALPFKESFPVGCEEPSSKEEMDRLRSEFTGPEPILKNHHSTWLQ
jgi:hypothetical protein